MVRWINVFLENWNRWNTTKWQVWIVSKSWNEMSIYLQNFWMIYSEKDTEKNGTFTSMTKLSGSSFSRFKNFDSFWFRFFDLFNGNRCSNAHAHNNSKNYTFLWWNKYFCLNNFFSWQDSNHWNITTYTPHFDKQIVQSTIKKRNEQN